MRPEARINEERSDLLQQYLVALACYFDAGTDVGEPKAIEELRSDVEKAVALLRNDVST
jgi:hypothetical protein